jgi:hypothetical protein
MGVRLAVMQWASALENGNVIPETKRAFMVARSEATFDEGPRWDAIIVARFEHWKMRGEDLSAAMAINDIRYEVALPQF